LEIVHHYTLHVLISAGVAVCGVSFQFFYRKSNKKLKEKCLLHELRFLVKN
jgi:hypothetical protein